MAAAESRKCMIVCMQETRLPEGKCRAVRNLARSTGWAFHAATATATGQRGPAPGGVAIAIRRPRGSAPADPGPAKASQTDGRFVACMVEGGAKNGTMAVACLYLDPCPSADDETKFASCVPWPGPGAWDTAAGPLPATGIVPLCPAAGAFGAVGRCPRRPDLAHLPPEHR